MSRRRKMGFVPALFSRAISTRRCWTNARPRHRLKPASICSRVRTWRNAHGLRLICRPALSSRKLWFARADNYRVFLPFALFFGKAGRYLYFVEVNTQCSLLGIFAKVVAMQIQIQIKPTSALDKRNTRVVLATQQLLQEGKTIEACNELRKIERRVAAHPAVVQLRRNLVANLYGWEHEDAAISRLQPAPVASVNGTTNGNGNGHAEQSANGNDAAAPMNSPLIEQAVAA